MAGEHEARSTKRRPPLRVAQKQFTRRVLMEAAVDVFDREGYLRATVDQIVDEASATRATFYQHFTGKIDVIRALSAEISDEGERMMESAFSSWQASGTADDVRAWMLRTVSYFESHAGALRAIDDAVTEDPQLRAERQEAWVAVVGILANYLSTLDQLYPPKLYAIALIGQLDVFMRTWILQGEEIDRDEALDMLTRLWCIALQFDGPASPGGQRADQNTPSSKKKQTTRGSGRAATF
jgi:AcrR family transcriptional regulator